MALPGVEVGACPVGLMSLGQGGVMGEMGEAGVQVPAGRAWLQAPGGDISAPSLQGFK